MKTFFLIAFSLIAFTSVQGLPYPSLSDYQSADALVNYLIYNSAYYYTPNSLFFQSYWYIPWEQAQEILNIMGRIYEKYGLNGVFLVVSDEAYISDISGYAASVVDSFNTKGIYHKEDCYTIILYYTIGTVPVGKKWGLKLSIASGENASHYLSASNAQTVSNDWGPKLAYYTYDNVVFFMQDIEKYMDNQAAWDEVPTGTKILIIVIVIIFLIIAAVVSLICRRICGCCLPGTYVSGGTYGQGAQTQNYAGGIQVTTGTY